MSDMFEEKADEIFAAAGVKKEGNEAIHEQCAAIMANCMANGSAMYGLSAKRFKMYEKQTKTLINDLKKMKKAGELQ